ncbi:MAG: calcium/sodium antiporter [Trueperaceae bacterium]
MILDALLLAVGLAVLIGGAEVLVRGASRLALAVGLTPLVVGLTVVAFGTSAPELAVSIGAGRAGLDGLALGNVVGSNVFNVLFILGLTAVIAPLVVARQLVRLDVPVMIGASALVVALAADGRIGPLDGALLAVGLVAYLGWLLYAGRRPKSEATTGNRAGAAVVAPARPRARLAVDLGLVAGGLVLLVLGSRWLVDGATGVAGALGVSDLIVGLTIVAAGTSMPEVATSVVATLRGQRDLAIGNVVGSNVFNLLGILGIAALATPGGLAVPAAVSAFDVWVMLAVAVVCLPIFVSGLGIARWEGVVLLVGYVAYAATLVRLAATGAVAPDPVALAWALGVPTAVLLMVGLGPSIARIRVRIARRPS